MSGECHHPKVGEAVSVAVEFDLARGVCSDTGKGDKDQDCDQGQQGISIHGNRSLDDLNVFYAGGAEDPTSIKFK